MNQIIYSIPSREEILGVLRAASRQLTANEIIQALSIKEQAQAGFFKRLSAMERDGQIYTDERGDFRLADPSSFISGRAEGHRDGYGFLIRDDGQADLFLPNAEMRRVMHNDRVLARIVNQDRRGRLEGHIVEITEHAHQTVIGRLTYQAGALWVVPEDKRIGHNILIAPAPKSPQSNSPDININQYADLIGQVVSVKLISFPDRYTQPLGRIVEVLGEIDSPGMEIEITIRQYGLPHRFSDAALAQAAQLPSAVSAADCENRVDLRNLPFVTIDGEDARDFDDAVYGQTIKIGRGNGFRLMVAIADVAYYVKPNDALDSEALLRSTSVYFPYRVIPMLPEKLSNGLCSLKPGVDRCALVCDITLNPQGNIKAYQFYPAVIHSVARLTYTEAAKILSNPQPSIAEIAEHNTIAYLQSLQILYSIYEALSRARKKSGAIDFETTETMILCNAAGKIEQILPRERNDAHKLIEECMLVANVCAAEFLKQHQHLGLYRVHAQPTKEKLANLHSFLKGLGLTLGGGQSPQASDYGALMSQARNRPDARAIQTMLMRSMQQAVYSPENVGHFGLGYEAYVHFTSPIRRYPDLLTHRALRAIIAQQEYQPDIAENIKLNTLLAPKLSPQRISAARAQKMMIWQKLGQHCSANERRADEASRDVEAWLKCYFMRDKLGEEYGGIINGIAPFGLFVQLDSLFVEGLVHVTELGADHFQYDEVKNELRGKNTGICYRLSDHVRVQVVRVELNTRKIDFRLIHNLTKISTKTPEKTTTTKTTTKTTTTPIQRRKKQKKQVISKFKNRNR